MTISDMNYSSNCSVHYITKKEYTIPVIKKVIYNPPATIILWEDSSKTVVKCCETDIYDSEKGFAMAIIKKLCNNDSAKFHRLFKTWALESNDESEDPILSIPVCNELRDSVRAAMTELGKRIFREGGGHGE